MLTPKQLRAIELLVSEVEQKVIAKELGVSDRTIQRWLKLDEFKEGLEGISYRPVAVSAVEVVNAHQSRRERLESLLDKAIDTLEATLENPDVRTCDRLKAAQMVGDWAGAGKLPDYETAIMALQELGWLPPRVLEASMEGSQEFRERIKKALISNPTP